MKSRRLHGRQRRGKIDAHQKISPAIISRIAARELLFNGQVADHLSVPKKRANYGKMKRSTRSASPISIRWRNIFMGR